MKPPKPKRQWDLWDVKLDTALQRRWQEGRKEYGGTDFVGHPLVELHEEILDGINYGTLAYGGRNNPIVLSLIHLEGETRKQLKAAKKAGIDLTKWEGGMEC